MSGFKLKNIFLFAALVFLLATVFCFAQEEYVYETRGERNPFVPLVNPDGSIIKVKPRQAAGGLDLEGIIYDKISMSYAIVNGAVVKMGDFVGDYQVAKIEEDKVIFMKNGQPLEVDLKREGE